MPRRIFPSYHTAIMSGFRVSTNYPSFTDWATRLAVTYCNVTTFRKQRTISAMWLNWQNSNYIAFVYIHYFLILNTPGRFRTCISFRNQQLVRFMLAPNQTLLANLLCGAPRAPRATSAATACDLQSSAEDPMPFATCRSIMRVPANAAQVKRRICLHWLVASTWFVGHCWYATAKHGLASLFRGTKRNVIQHRSPYFTQ